MARNKLYDMKKIDKGILEIYQDKDDFIYYKYESLEYNPEWFVLQKDGLIRKLSKDKSVQLEGKIK